MITKIVFYKMITYAWETSTKSTEERKNGKKEKAKKAWQLTDEFCCAIDEYIALYCQKTYSKSDKEILSAIIDILKNIVLKRAEVQFVAENDLGSSSGWNRWRDHNY